MKYILNKLQDKTTNNFKINDIELDLDLPVINEFTNYEISNNNLLIKQEIKESKLTTKIGLEFTKYLELTITVPKYTEIKEPIFITHNNDLISNIKFIFEENSSANFIIKYTTTDNNKYFNYQKEETISKENSNCSITYINTMNKNSINMIAVENKLDENSKITHNIIDIGGSTRLYNINSKVEGYASENYVNNIYIGKDENIIDINYNLENIGKKTINNLVVEGALDDNSKKNFRGIIDFKEGATSSIGQENENCILLSDTCRARSLPALLCHEDDVVGAHGESSGKIAKEKLFYLMSRGYTEKEAEKLIVVANFNSIINKINDDKTQKELLDKINELI